MALSILAINGPVAIGAPIKESVGDNCWKFPILLESAF